MALIMCASTKGHNAASDPNKRKQFDTSFDRGLYRVDGLNFLQMYTLRIPLGKITKMRM